MRRAGLDYSLATFARKDRILPIFFLRRRQTARAPHVGTARRSSSGRQLPPLGYVCDGVRRRVANRLSLLGMPSVLEDASCLRPSALSQHARARPL